MSDLSSGPWSLLPANGDFLAEMHTAPVRHADLRAVEGGSGRHLLVRPEAAAEHRRLRLANKHWHAHGRFYNEDDSVGYDVLGYDIDVSIVARSAVDRRPRAHSIAGAGVGADDSCTLRLAESLVVQSVVSDQFGRLFSLRVRNQNTIIVNLPAFLIRDERLLLTIVYAGRLQPQRADTRGAGAARSDAPGAAPDDTGVPQFQPERSYPVQQPELLVSAGAGHRLRDRQHPDDRASPVRGRRQRRPRRRFSDRRSREGCRAARKRSISSPRRTRSVTWRSS